MEHPAGTATAQAYYQFMLGRDLEANGETAKAMAAYTAAARLDPQSAEVRAELAGFFARQGHVEDASREARAALALDPANHEANRILGSILASLAEPGVGGDASDRTLAEAASYLERGRRGDGADADPSIDLLLARLYVRGRHYDQAIALLQDLLDREMIPEAYLLLAEAWSGAGNISEATRALESGAEANPRLLVSLAEMYEEQQQWGSAASAYERAAALTPQSAEVKTRWAGALLNIQDDAATARARQMLEGLAAARPRDDRTLYLLSQAQRRSQDLASAEATARRVIALDPKGLWGPWALAQVLEDRRDYAGVVTTLSAALSEFSTRETPPPRQALAMLTHLGFAQLQLGQNDEAVETFARAKEASGGDDTLDLYLGQAYVSARRFAEALSVSGRSGQRTRAMSGWCSSRRGRWPAPAVAARPSRRCARSSTPVPISRPRISRSPTCSWTMAASPRRTRCSTTRRRAFRTTCRCRSSAGPCTSARKTTGTPRRRSGR